MGRGDLKQSVTVDLEGNLPRRSKAYEKALERMGKRGQQHLSGMARMSNIAGRSIDKLGNRYIGLATGAAVVLAAKQVGDLSERYTRLGISANISDEKVQGLKEAVFEVSQAPDIRADPSKFLDAIDSILEKTGDFNFVKANIRNIGLVLQATGAAGRDVGGMLAEFQKQGITAPKKVLQAIDAFNVQGKEGAFILSDLASQGPRVVAAYNAVGRSGVRAMKEMGAALQVIRMGTGSSEQAATAFEAMLRTFSDPKKIAKLKELGGISIFDPDQLKKGKEQLRPINELMVEIIEAAKGKQTNLAQVFDAEALRAFNAPLAEFNRIGSIESLAKFMRVQGDGATTMRDSARAAKEFNSVITNLGTSWKRFADNNLAEPLQDVADILGFISDESAQLTLETAKWGAAVLGVAIGARKIANVYRRGLFGGGAMAGKGGLESLVKAGKPIPVFVVNNGKGGLPGAGGAGAAGGAAASRGRNPGRWGMLRAAGNMKTVAAMGAGAVGLAGLAAGGAGAAGYGAGSLAYKAIEETEAADSIGSFFAHTLALFSDEAMAAVAKNRRMGSDPLDAPGAKGTLKIEIVSDTPVRVREMSATGIDLDVDAGPTMSMMP